MTSERPLLAVGAGVFLAGALGVMDLVLTTVVALAITAERMLPRPVPVARVTGVVALVAGAVWLLHAAGAR